ncbi:unnamed protein product [Allacma fusca]|uniref:Lamin n=1 Tax=Allacma fusca TaxID=39272 RepID=A0A8J2NT86_9HEXA|nr:unnamed protein product [Allacma fusca]
MSSKSAKRSAASSSTAGASIQTPQAPTSTSFNVQSPITPTRMSRIQEKNTLASLNDRLAAYIERNQQLENENAAFSKQLAKSEETMTRTITRVRDTYDQELVDARRLIDDSARERARLDLECSQLRKDLQDVKEKLERKIKEAAAANRNLSQLDARFQDLTAQNNKLGSERDSLARERKELEDEVIRLNRELELLRRQLEQEILLRTDLDSKLKSKDEELSFQTRCHEQEVTEIKTRRSQEIQEVDGRLQQEYELKLQQSIQELRAEYEAQLRNNKDELDGLYEQKNADLRAQMKRLQSSSASKGEELTSLSSRCDTLTKQISAIESERNGLLNKIKDLERKIDLDHSRFAALLNDRDGEIDRLVSEKSALMSDYQDLMDTKVALDNEIGMYRKLLEGEEKRLSLSPKRALTRDETPSGAGGRRGTPLRVTKRKRYEEETMDSAAEFDTNTITHGDIEISEDDPEGKYIRLHNKSDKEVSISGWQLIRLSGDIDTTHKFNRQAKVDARATITVWSSDATGGVHEPPQNIVMKGQKWYTSEHFKTVLINSNGDEQAIRETRRLQISRQRKRLGFGQPEDLFQQEGERVEGERCKNSSS